MIIYLNKHAKASSGRLWVGGSWQSSDTVALPPGCMEVPVPAPGNQRHWYAEHCRAPPPAPQQKCPYLPASPRKPSTSDFLFLLLYNFCWFPVHLLNFLIVFFCVLLVTDEWVWEQEGFLFLERNLCLWIGFDSHETVWSRFMIRYLWLEISVCWELGQIFSTVTNDKCLFVVMLQGC